jgi:hypothetical protein
LQPVDRVYSSFLFFFFATTMTFDSVASVQKSAECTKGNAQFFARSGLFSEFEKAFGPLVKCSAMTGTHQYPKRIEFKFKKNLRIDVMDVENFDQRFSWISIHFLDRKADVNGVYSVLGKHFQYMGFTIDWNRYLMTSDGEDSVLFYCDSLYQTGVLASARFNQNQLLKIEYGFLEKHFCPKTVSELNNLFKK